MLSFKDLSVNYEGKPALIDFNLQVGKKEIVALVGESGSGKTTAIRSAIGILPGNGQILKGSISYKGRDLLDLSSKEWQEIRGREIAMIFQDSGLTFNPIRTIGNQFVEYINCHEKMSKKEAMEKARDMLDRMGLSNPDRILKSYIFELSGGMRQRVGIAMAMTYKPELLLADEPTSALDVTTQAQIVKQMIDLKEQFSTSILMVTHNLGVAAYMADRILVMKDGRVVEEGFSRDIIERPQNEYTRLLIASVPDMGREK